MKIKNPLTPPITPSTTKISTPEIKAKVATVAHELAGLVGGDEDVKKKERKKASEQVSEAEKRKKLKGLGAKCGVSQKDSLSEATKKIVHGILADHYDSDEKGFQWMVSEISQFILADGELETLFEKSLAVMRSEA